MTLKKVSLVEREAEAFEAWRKLEEAAMAEGGLLSLHQVQERFVSEFAVALEPYPRDLSDADTKKVMAGFLLDVFVPQYSAAIETLRKLG